MHLHSSITTAIQSEQLKPSLNITIKRKYQVLAFCILAFHTVTLQTCLQKQAGPDLFSAWGELAASHNENPA